MDRWKSIEISDAAIIKRVLSGEKELFELLMRRYNQTLYRVIRSYLNSEEDVEDLMQDVYLKAYQKLDQFKGDASFSTWLIRVGINEALQHLRKNKRTPKVNGYPETIDRVIQLPDATQMNPERYAIKRETSLLVERAIDRLPEKYRLIFVMHELEGMANAEIAACLNLSDSNVKVRLHRAKNLLKNDLYSLTADTAIFEFGADRCDRLVKEVLGRM